MKLMNITNNLGVSVMRVNKNDINHQLSRIDQEHELRVEEIKEQFQLTETKADTAEIAINSLIHKELDINTKELYEAGKSFIQEDNDITKESLVNKLLEYLKTQSPSKQLRKSAKRLLKRRGF